jgi:hypothetical protein
MAEEIRLMVTYLMARSPARFLPSAISTNEDMSMTSNQTYKLNRSPVRNAPFTPSSKHEIQRVIAEYLALLVHAGQ